METAWVYQYISLNQEPEKIVRIIEKVSRYKILPVLDVEDSLQIPLNVRRTLELKSQARNCLEDVIEILSSNKKDYLLCLRLNSIDSPEFNKDLDVLQKLKNRVTWNGLFIPKVHSDLILKKYLDSLQGIKFKEIIVMIESQAGRDNLDETLKLALTSRISKIHFGHWDYFYDIGEFPVPSHISERFWEIVRDMVYRIESNGFHYIHTPFSDIMNHSIFISIIGLLRKYTRFRFGVTTLTYNQGLAVCNSNIKNQGLVPVRINFNDMQKNEEAKRIIGLFNRPDDIDFSFHIDKKDYRFYAPHEYLNALNYLNHNNDKKTD